MERTDANETHKQLYEEFLELCCIADKGGFHTIWTGEHHGIEFSITPNPLLLLTAIANKTKNVRLGTATLIAPFWHPIKLAGELAMTDVITNGRLEIGISKGAYSFEYDRLVTNLNSKTAGEMMREIIPCVKKLWQNDYVHNGKHWSFPATISSPLPIQKPHPPVWVACQHPFTFNFAVANDCNIQVAPLWNGDIEAKNLIKKFDTAVLNHPTANKPKIMILNHTYVAETESALHKASEKFSNFYNEFTNWFENKLPIKNGVMKSLNSAESVKKEELSPNVLRKNLMIGTPNQVIKRLKEYENLGYDEYAVWLANGMSFSEKKEFLKLFINKVIPAFS